MQGISAKQERRRERESALQGKQCLVCKRWFSRPSRSPGLCQRCAEKAKAPEPLGGPTGGGVRGVTSLDPYPLIENRSPKISTKNGRPLCGFKCEEGQDASRS
jgi:hypothetical protein